MNDYREAVELATARSAWHFRRLPRMSKAIRQRNEMVSAAVREIAWNAQQRLHKRLSRLLVRGKPPGQAVAAVARELMLHAARVREISLGINLLRCGQPWL
jgi:uncharacterized protein YoaH (UPF0181 family)